MEQENKTEACCITQCDVPMDQHYWETRWEKQETGWDIGYPSSAITKYMDGIADKNTAILIPGCGNAYEAEFLWDQGFRNNTILDFAPKAVEILQEKFKDKHGINIICEDFFEHQGSYDLIIEQTFFCAIPTLKRKDYAKKAHDLLKENGKLVGLLFNRNFTETGPPFGGSIAEYEFIFKKYFQILVMEECENSIKPREGTEIFINLKKLE